MCPLSPLLCVCGVLGYVAPVQRCARSVCCIACAVSWATWLLFTGVSARCVVLRVRCPGPLRSSSPVRSPGVLCGVLGHLAPVHRCARSVCCAVGCVRGASLRGGYPPIGTVAIRGRQGLGTLRARTRPSGRRLFVAGRRWVPSGRTRVHPDGGGSVAGRGWVRCRARTHLSGRRRVLLGTCPRSRGPLRVLRALRVCGTRQPSLLGTCPCALVVACGVPLWRASWPRVVRRALSSPVALRAPIGFPDAVVPFPTPGACAPGFTGWLRGARGSWPRTGLIVPAAGPRRDRGQGSLCVVPVRGPVMGLSLAGPSGVGLGLRALRWLACVDPVTDASSFPYRPSFDGGLGRCTAAVSCGRRHLPLRVGGRHAWVPCVCACAGKKRCTDWCDDRCDDQRTNWCNTCFSAFFLGKIHI